VHFWKYRKLISWYFRYYRKYHDIYATVQRRREAVHHCWSLSSWPLQNMSRSCAWVRLIRGFRVVGLDREWARNVCLQWVRFGDFFGHGSIRSPGSRLVWFGSVIPSVGLDRVRRVDEKYTDLSPPLSGVGRCSVHNVWWRGKCVAIVEWRKSDSLRPNDRENAETHPRDVASVTRACLVLTLHAPRRGRRCRHFRPLVSTSLMFVLFGMIARSKWWDATPPSIDRHA